MPSATSAAGTGAAPAATDAPAVGADPTAAAGGDSAPSALPADSISSFTVVGDRDGGASGTVAAPTDKGDVAVPAEVPDNSSNVQVVVVSKLQVFCSRGAFQIFWDFEHLNVPMFDFNHTNLR